LNIFNPTEKEVLSSGANMPYVNIKVTKEGVTAEQKVQLIKGVTDLLWDVLKKPPQTVFVVIDEVDTDNWGIAGEPVTAIRQRMKK
jgi:4-oxalocrotonate tautomerase